MLQKQVRGVGEKVGDGARVIVAGKESDEVATDLDQEEDVVRV